MVSAVQETAPSRAETALQVRVEAFMAAPNPGEAEFEALALDIFAFQFEGDPAYRRFGRQRGRSPRTVRSWREIPAVPIGAFKDLSLGCTPPAQAGRTFMTSGTTRAEQRGQVHHRSLDLYDRSMRLGFERS